MLATLSKYSLKTPLNSRLFSSMVVVRNLPIDWSASDVVGGLNDRRITKINFIKNKSGDKTGKAVFHFKNEKDALSSMKSHQGRTILDKHLYLELYKSEVKTVDETATEDPEKFQERLNRRVYIQNIPSSASRDDIYALVSNFSDSCDLRMPMTDNQTHNGYAIVYLEKADHVAEFINNFDNTELYNRNLKVSMKLGSHETSDESRLEDKLDYYEYIKRKYNATLRDPGVLEIPTIRSGISHHLSASPSKEERNQLLAKIMHPDDQTLTSVAKASIHSLNK